MVFLKHNSATLNNRDHFTHRFKDIAMDLIVTAIRTQTQRGAMMGDVQ